MNEKMILRALQMIGERRDYWKDRVNGTTHSVECLRYEASAAAVAYDSAFSILKAAISENSDFLNQFDYYKDF